MSSEQSKPVMLSQSQLLAVFDPDPKRAEERYLELHQKLVRYFEWNRAAEPDDMAQEALKRGFARLQEGQTITAQDPAGYFFGIARNLVREGWSVRKTEQLEDQPLLAAQPSFRRLNPSEQAIFLRQCLYTLPKDDREMLIAYVEGNGDAWGRKAGLEPGALRLRIHRLRKKFEAMADARTITSVTRKS
jgi:DNA-directed RNA polymerase specialized sigma24 family protein